MRRMFTLLSLPVLVVTLAVSAASANAATGNHYATSSAARVSTPKATACQPGGCAIIRNVWNQLCLDGRENSTTGVHMFACTLDPSTEVWYLGTALSAQGYLQDAGNNWCLDGRETSTGGVHMAPCGSDPATQKWQLFQPQGREYQLRDLGNYWCLNGDTAAYGGVTVQPCHSNAATEYWNFAAA